MSVSATATRKDIDDVLNVLDIIMSRLDERFNNVEGELETTQKRILNIHGHLDHIEKRLETSEHERFAMANQLNRLHDWVEKAARHERWSHELASKLEYRLSA